MSSATDITAPPRVMAVNDMHFVFAFIGSSHEALVGLHRKPSKKKKTKAATAKKIWVTQHHRRKLRSVNIRR